MFIQEGKVEIEGVHVTFTKEVDGAYRIDRIEVPEEYRRRGMMERVLSLIVEEAKVFKVTLGVHIMPDGYPKAPMSCEIADGMIRVFDRLGFVFMTDGEDVYRNELVRYPF